MQTKKAWQAGVVFLLPIALVSLILAGLVLSTTLNKTLSKVSSPVVLSATPIPEPTVDPTPSSTPLGASIYENSSNSINQKTSIKVKIENGEGYIRIDNNGEITEENF